ncbi:bile acid:sodium symporter family protein [Listeria booriae]|uniref:Bile acid:sodium symporter n=1 Tax=Listeria booriae TaxID=1552123 RepID=A0A099VZW5_9LIST|nr:hypothetical protein [Listeria booriae]KGL37956.1 hypothetical protein EP57_15475 [Listeria booriae]STY45954.1 Sodium Bile acid symporter family [Listeria booriae]
MEQVNQVLVSMQPYVLLVFVYATMIAVGFTTTTKQLGVAFRRPIPMILCVIFNILVAPLIAALVTNGLADSLGGKAEATTIIIAAVLINLFAGAPAGMKNVQLGGGNGANAVAMLVVLSMAVVICTPFTAPLFLPGDVTIPVSKIVWTLIILVVIPLGIGLALNSWKPTFTKKALKSINETSSISMILVLICFMLPNLQSVFDTGFYVVCIFVLIVFANFGITYFGTIGTIQDKKTVSLLSMSKNFGVALSVATAAFASYDIIPAMMTYAIVMMLACLPISLFLKHIK